MMARTFPCKLQSQALLVLTILSIVSVGCAFPSVKGSGFIVSYSTANGLQKKETNYHHRSPVDATVAPLTVYDSTANRIALRSSNDDDDDDTNDSITARFLDPIIDDKGLPIADALLSQIVAPSLQVFWLSFLHAPLPSWLSSSRGLGMLYNSNPAYGSLIAPTLIHGAGLAVCWTMGALAAKGYDSDAFNISGGRGYKTVISRIVQGGAFASGVLIFSTQIDLLLEFGRWVQLGESPTTDVRLIQAAAELINDIFFEAIVLTSWRLYRASLTGNPDGRPPNYKP